MCVHIIGEKLCRCTQAINIKQFQTHVDCSQTPFIITISLNTYWAGLHLCWNMTKEHRLTASLLPLPFQDGQEDRLRLDILMYVRTKDGDRGVDSQHENRQTKQLEALTNYLQRYDLRAQCIKLIIS